MELRRDRARLRSHWKSWGSERKTRAGERVERKWERELAFLEKPSMFQERTVRRGASTDLSKLGGKTDERGEREGRRVGGRGVGGRSSPGRIALLLLGVGEIVRRGREPDVGRLGRGRSSREPHREERGRRRGGKGVRRGEGRGRGSRWRKKRRRWHGVTWR